VRELERRSHPFWTQDQIDYAKSVMLNEFSKALKADAQEWDRELRRSTRNSFIKISMEYKGRAHPIFRYQEKQLETKVTCDICTLDYTIYGLFAFCPDCGTHNSLQILKKNLDLVEKLVALAEEESDPELIELLIVKALETAVSTFDGFGRAYCEANARQATHLDQAKKLSFQNLGQARSSFRDLFSRDFAQNLTVSEWEFVVRCFQKRHLFAHKMGIVDNAYKQKTNDPETMVGRKIRITAEELHELIPLLIQLGEQF
jgi:hypothetical protein